MVAKGRGALASRRSDSQSGEQWTADHIVWSREYVKERIEYLFCPATTWLLNGLRWSTTELFKRWLFVRHADRFLNRDDTSSGIDRDDSSDRDDIQRGNMPQTYSGRGAEETAAETSAPAPVKPRQRTSSTKVELLKKKKRLEMERKKQQEERLGLDTGVERHEGTIGPSVADVPISDAPVDKGSTLSNGEVGESKKEETTSRKTSSEPKELKSTVDSHERLGKLVEALRKKNKQLESENVQLEEMISSLDSNLKKSEDEILALNGSIKQLMKSKQNTEDRSAVLQSKLEETELLVESYKSTIETLEQKLVVKEKESATATAERSVSETHIIASLRKDVEAAERLLEDERRAHALSRKNFASREQELDESVTRAAAALSESQAKIDHYSAKLAESQERCTILEADIDALSRQHQSNNDRSGTHDVSLSVSKERMQELEADLAAALREGAAARNTVKSLEDDIVRIRTENMSLKQQLSTFQASDTVELQLKIKELTDLLYSKQSQIENLTAERGALQMQLDRQGSSSRSDGMRRRSAAVDKMFSGESYDNVVPMNALGPGYERLANAPGHLGGAVQAGARILDAIALQAVILIRQSPLWRLGVFAYILGMHAFIYALLFFHQQVNMGSPGDIVDSKAVHATSMGTVGG